MSDAPSGSPASAATPPTTGDWPAGAGFHLVVDRVGVELGGRRVLQDVDLVLVAGSPVAVTGPSGSGKTVLCLVLAGALRPTRGQIRLGRGEGAGAPGAREARGPAGREGAGYLAGLILQTHGLVSGLTAEENVALPLQARRVDRAVVASRTRRALFDLGLEKHATRPVDELSGGERQRVGIARALALDPSVLIADEPTSELDPGNRERVLALFADLARRGRVVAIASDDPEVVEGCGSVVVLERGTVAIKDARIDARLDTPNVSY